MICPFCKEEIKDGAIKCRYCGSMLDGSSQISAQADRPTLAEVKKICPYCLQKISEVAVRCTNCGRTLKHGSAIYSLFATTLEPLLLIGIFVSYFLDWINTRFLNFFGNGPSYGRTGEELFQRSWVPIATLILIMLNMFWYLSSLKNKSKALHISKSVISLLLGIFVVFISLIIVIEIGNHGRDAQIGIGWLIAMSCSVVLIVLSILAFKNIPKSEESKESNDDIINKIISEK